MATLDQPNPPFRLQSRPVQPPPGARQTETYVEHPQSTGKARALAVVACLAALAGVVFLAFSTFDFVQHLDRQVHAVHCTFAPGLVGPSAIDKEAAGCRAAMFSPYSSVLRTKIWGGIPVSLFGLGTYAFFFTFALALAVARKMDKRATTFMAFASFVPLAATLYFAYLSFARVGAVCKLCTGTYIASIVLCVAAWMLKKTVEEEGPDEDDLAARQARRDPGADYSSRKPSELHRFKPLLWVAELAIFLFVPAIAYAAQVPDYTKYVTACHGLARPDDIHHALLPIPTSPGASTPATMLLDPLCPSCKALDERLHANGMIDSLKLRAVVFPLDSDCNWMLSEAVHPGACVVAKALLCAGDRAGTLLSWAYDHQEDLAKDPQQIFSEFPETKTCAQSDDTRRRLDQNLRFAIDNQLPVMTPQLFLGDHGEHAVCDEDTDLGLDYALSKMGVSQ